jgi:hypothetical protein
VHLLNAWPVGDDVNQEGFKLSRGVARAPTIQPLKSTPGLLERLMAMGLNRRARSSGRYQVEIVRLRKDQVHSEEDNGFHCQDDGNLDDTNALTSMRSLEATVASGKVDAALFGTTLKPRDMRGRGLASAQNIGDRA